MITAPPSMFVIAGPNGAGKTTVAMHVLPKTLGIAQFVNADLIARGISPFAPPSADLDAARVLLHRIRTLIDRRETFAFETTLASRSYVALLSGAIASGYRIHIVYIWIDSVECALTRIADRIASGVIMCRRKRCDGAIIVVCGTSRNVTCRWQRLGRCGIIRVRSFERSPTGSRGCLRPSRMPSPMHESLPRTVRPAPIDAGEAAALFAKLGEGLVEAIRAEVARRRAAGLPVYVSGVDGQVEDVAAQHSAMRPVAEPSLREEIE